MYITNIVVELVHAPLITPFKTALRTVHAIENIKVSVETSEGLVGIGEAAPTHAITGESLASIRFAIEGVIAPAIKGLPIAELAVITEKIRAAIYSNTSAKAAVEMAVYDVWAKSFNAPLYQLLGGYRQELTTDITISVNEQEEMVRDSLEAVARGFSILKVKVGKDAAGDVARIKAIHDAVGRDIVLRIDANQGWTPKEAVTIIGKLEDLGVPMELVEQPVHYSDIAGMQYVTAHTQTDILADESVFSTKEAITVIEKRAANLINIKLMKTGGFAEAQKIVHIAQAHGIPCMIGCMLETNISVAAAAHFAAANANITMIDLDGPSLCAQQPVEGGPLFNGERITMTNAPGLGFL